MMCNKTSQIITIILIFAAALWLFLLHSQFIGEFEQIYRRGLELPAVTKFMFANSHYWWLFAIVIAVISYLPLLLIKDPRWAWLSPLLAVLLLGLSILVMFLPML